MRIVCILTVVLAIGTVVACSTPQDKAYKAQEMVHRERLKLVDEYKKCLKNAGADKDKVEACDQYLRAAEALK